MTKEKSKWAGGQSFGPGSALIFTVDDGDTPPPPFITDGHHPERPPRRAAQPISSADSG
jgi:hypothetical protein